MAVGGRLALPAHRGRGGAGGAAFWWRLGLLVLTGCRFWVAWRAPLSADEAYYWVWSRAPAWGYLDHPPMVAAWIRAGCAVAGDTALGVRLLGPVAALLGTLALARAAEDLAPKRHAGVAAGLLFNATLVANAGAVVMTPDTPLLLFWTLALAALVRLHASGHAYWWLAVGAAGGLALDSKYTGVLLAGGVVAWLVAVRPARMWWRAWQMWAGAALALGLFLPVLAWNASHHFASFAKQGGRTGDWHPGQALRYLGELAAGQLGLASPVVAVVLAVGMVRAARGLWRGEAAGGLLACVTWLPAAVFVEHALGGRVQANWPAVIYPGAVLAAVCLGAAPVRFWRPGAWLGLALSAAVCLQAAVQPMVLRRGLDFTLIRLAGWQDLAGAVFVAERQQGADFVAADSYGLASELTFRLHGPVVGIEPRWAFFDLPAVGSGLPAGGLGGLGGRTGLLVRSAREAGGPDPRLWREVHAVGEVVRARGGVVAERYRLLRVVGRDGPLAAGLAAVVLPEAVRRVHQGQVAGEGEGVR